MSSTTSAPARATLTARKKSLTVDFNPVSLQYSIKNEFDPDKSKKTKQYVSQSSAQLTLDLLFDSTETGEDVRVKTARVALMLRPVRKVPPSVAFDWGQYSFVGFVESYKETIDFFSHDGVPLRATINLTLTQKDKVFTDLAKIDKQQEQQGDPVQAPNGESNNPQQVADQGGDPNAAREIARNNDRESVREGGGDSMVVDDGEGEIGPPPAFAPSGGGGGEPAGAGFAAEANDAANQAGEGLSGAQQLAADLEDAANETQALQDEIQSAAQDAEALADSAGVDVQEAERFGIETGSGALVTGAPFGSAASAGVSAAAGAFAGLRSRVARAARIDPERLLPDPDASALSADQNGSFAVGGRAETQSPTSFHTDVRGVPSRGRETRIEFED